MRTKSPKSNTQRYLPFKEIREGVIIMKDGSMRTILMVNSINFNLKSPDEQTALLNNFQNFLNALEFPLQILVQSRVLDLDDYLKNLEQLSSTQSNELLQLHTKEYVEFVKELIGITNIMSKTFYIIISDQGLPTKKSRLAGWFSRPVTPTGRFTEARNQLLGTANLVANNLASIGLNSVSLNTKEVIDLLYATYNPDTARRQKLFNASSVDADVIIALTKAKRI